MPDLSSCRALVPAYPVAVLLSRRVISPRGRVLRGSFSGAFAGAASGPADVVARLTGFGVGKAGQHHPQVRFLNSRVRSVMHGRSVSAVDHINGVRDDNRLCNLRFADRATNARNRTNWTHTKLLGAHPKPGGRFAATITADGASYFLGVYATEQEAHERYCAARDACTRAEVEARKRVLEGLANESRPRVTLTVLEEVQASRRAA